jgi:hypothetical protein
MVLLLLLLLLLLFPSPGPVLVHARERYRDFDFNASRINYEAFKIRPHRGKFLVHEVALLDQAIPAGLGAAYLAEAGDQILAVNGERVSTMSLREILRQPAGKFMLPLVEQEPDPDSQQDGEETPSHQVLRWLRLEIVEAESMTFRPQRAARQAQMRRANFELREKDQLQRAKEESKKQAERQRQLDVEEGEKSQARRLREEQETKHQQTQLKAAQEMATKQASIESAEKKRAEGAYKREQGRKKTQQQAIAENHVKSTELAAAAALASQQAREAKRSLAVEDGTKLAEAQAAALAQQNTHKIAAVRERVARENEEHRKQSEEDEKDREHLAELQKADEIARKALVESIRVEQQAKKDEGEREVARVQEEGRKAELDPYTYHLAKYRNRGPLGLFFKPNLLPLTINGGDLAMGLEEGDELIAVNDENLLDSTSADEITEVIIEASWPKTLKFRRSKGAAGAAGGGAEIGGGGGGDTPRGGGSAVEITIVKPKLLSGWKLGFELAHFGAERAKLCKPTSVERATPTDACKELQLGGQSYAGKFVLAIRGGCMFSVKANHIAKSGALGAIVMNTDENTVRMPTSPKDKVHLEGPAMMVRRSDGKLMEGVLKVLDVMGEGQLLVRLAGGGTGCGMLVGDEEFRRPFKPLPGGKGGAADARLHLWAGDEDILSLEVVKAQFGGPHTSEPIKAVVADPITGCDEKGFAVPIRGALVILIRGGCSFEEKCRRVQRTGGKGCIVVNTRGKVTAMTPGEGGAKDIDIPVGMVEKGTLEKIEELKDRGTREMLARMVV